MLGSERRCAIKVLELLLIGARGLVGCKALSRDGMDIFGRNRGRGEHCLAHHAVIALRIVVGNEAFVAPEPMCALPREHPAIRLTGQQLIKPAWGRAAGESDAE